jgi:hypothetical protein
MNTSRFHALHALPALLLLFLVSRAFPQVTLPGGVTVPKEKMIVFIFVGHSNMEGRANTLDQTAHPRVWLWYLQSGYDANAFTANAWNAAKEPVYHAGQFIGAGPQLKFAKRMADLYPDYTIGIVSNPYAVRRCEGIGEQAGGEIQGRVINYSIENIMTAIMRYHLRKLPQLRPPDALPLSLL